MREFPHLKGANSYPGAGREVYEQIAGSFDYGEWGKGAKLTLTWVPWSVYDAERANDVPGFDTEQERDAWFRKYAETHKSETHVLDTYVRYQLNDYVDLPFTFDSAARYNYLIVEYQNAPVENSTPSLKRWFFHIGNVSYESANCTRALLVCDWWVTCAPYMDFSNMVLERGHAPVAASSVSAYLKDPINNSAYLLAPDVDFGGPEHVRAAKDIVFNAGAVFAVVCTRGCDLAADFSDYKNPVSQNVFCDGVPSRYALAVNASDLQTFLANMHFQAPAAFQSIEAVFMAGEKLLNLGGVATVLGCTCYTTVGGKSSREPVTLYQGDFGFPSRYKHLAKLYTAPYSHIEVCDDSGAASVINIETLSGSGVIVDYAFNAAFPWLKLTANVSNAGAAPRTVSFKTATAHEMKLGGKWYELLKTWDVPCFSIVQSAAERYDYQQHYSVEQAKSNAETAYTNAKSSIDTANTNALASNQTSYDNTAAANETAQTNANNNATLITANNAISVACNTATTAESNSGSLIAMYRGNTKMDSDASADAAFASASYAADKDAIAAASANNMAGAINSTISLVASAASMGAAGAAVGAASGAAAAGVGAIPGAAVGFLAGAATSVISYAAAESSNNVSQSNSSALYGASITSIQSKKASAKSHAEDTTNTSCDVATKNTATVNEASTKTATNSADNTRTNASNTRALADANNTRSKNTNDANADRSKFTATGNAQRTRTNALNAVQAGIANAGMQAGGSYGIDRAGDTATTRAQMLSINVVTECDAAINQAGGRFLRYGYTLNQIWDFKTFNVMKHFSYWQVSDVYALGAWEVPEEGQNAVRDMLYSGVTCWKDPSEIGKVSIYDN